jgi:hypothetical protein
MAAMLALPEPQRDVRGLHGRAHDPAQLGVQRVERHLVAQARGERLERALRVVLAPVEAAVDRPLDAGTRGAEQRGAGSCR